MNATLKRRLAYGITVLGLVLLGLSTRTFAAVLPQFIADHFGDALWAAMVYFGMRFLLIENSPRYAALLSLLFCFAIEFSQLYQAPWLNEIRQTTLGPLVLGKGFLAIDLLRYMAGIFFSYRADVYFIRPKFRPHILPVQKKAPRTRKKSSSVNF
jgi:hypothetical protein